MEATDQEMFDSAVEQTENAPEAATEASTEAKEAPARDEAGKYTSKAPEGATEVAEDPAAQPKAETEAEARIPSWRLAEDSQRRREAETQLNDMRAEMRQMQLAIANQQKPQPQQQPPMDPFADPEGFARNMQQSFEQRLAHIQLQNSLQFARHAHHETFDNAYEAFVDHAHKTRDAATYQRVMHASDPGEALVQWYKEQELQRELGGTDLKTFIDNQREAWMKDPAVQAKVIEAFKATQSSAAPSNLTNLPPSISRHSSAAPQHDVGDTSDAGMFTYATRS